MIRFEVAGRTMADIERAIADEFQAAGIPSSAKYHWSADGQAFDISDHKGGPRFLQSGYRAHVKVEYP